MKNNTGLIFLILLLLLVSRLEVSAKIVIKTGSLAPYIVNMWDAYPSVFPGQDAAPENFFTKPNGLPAQWLNGDNPGGDSLILNAGNDTSICLSGIYIPVSGYNENFYFTEWATAGDGFFVEAINLNTEYAPGPLDILNGAVSLYLVGVNVEPDFYRRVDSLHIELYPEPSCFAGIDASTCNGNEFQTLAAAQNYSEVLWTSSGDGSFDLPNTMVSSYYHGAQDLNAGQVTLTLTAFEISPCLLPAENSLTLTILKTPIVEAGNDTILCNGSPLQLNGDVENAGEIIWLTNGDGTFSDQNIADPIYYPGQLDQNTGTVLLSLIITPEYPCEAYAMDYLELTIVSMPTVFIGPDQTICETDTLQCLAVGDNYESVLWMALGGDGYFTHPFEINSDYVLGEYEKSTGFFFVMMIASAINPCLNEVTAFFRVDIIDNAFISAGGDHLICENDTATIYGIGERFDGIFWETSGDGIFAGGNGQMQLYLPGETDIQNGIAELYLIAQSIAPCDALVTDTLNIIIQKKLSVNAGSDATTCSEIQLEGNAENFSQIIWTSSGDGSFEDPEILNPVYYAGSQDIQAVEFYLYLYAQSIVPCNTFISDSLIISIDRPVIETSTVHAQEIFRGNAMELFVEVTSFDEVNYQWYQDDNLIINQVSPQLLIENCQPENAGHYHCLFSNNCFAYSSDTALIRIYDTTMQHISINTGWNAVSSYVTPASTDIEFVLSPIMDEIIIMYNNDGVFYPFLDLQSFTSWNPNTGYIIKSSGSDNLDISGFVKYPPDPATILPGWSTLPVNTACLFNVADVFSAYPEIKAIKEIGGSRVYWPAKNIFTLETIHPGKAYDIYNASSDAITIVFPGCYE